MFLKFLKFSKSSINFSEQFFRFLDKKIKIGIFVSFLTNKLKYFFKKLKTDFRENNATVCIKFANLGSNLVNFIRINLNYFCQLIGACLELSKKKIFWILISNESRRLSLLINQTNRYPNSVNKNTRLEL